MARPEQTEKPTPKRRHEARERGQVPRSQELPGAVIFFAAVLLIYGLFGRALASVQSSVQTAFAHAGAHQEPNIHTAQTLLARAMMPYLPLVMLFFGVAFVLGVLANVGQFGFIFSPKPLQPSFSKINPISGFGRLFSKQIVVNLAKQVLKLAAVAIILYQTISQNLGFLAQVGQATPDTFLMMLVNLIFAIAWKFGLLLVVIGILDHLWMRYQYEDSLKMTKQEVKDEWRQSEGNPEAKAALKRRQREFARRRMMAAIPRATVVVTNPTHFAVALEWNELEMEAPVVTAKGADLLAKRIRQLAQEHGVPIMENPPLARTLYEKVELDQALPPNMYAAVAQVIAFVFKLKRKTIA